MLFGYTYTELLIQAGWMMGFAATIAALVGIGAFIIFILRENVWVAPLGSTILLSQLGNTRWHNSEIGRVALFIGAALALWTIYCAFEALRRFIRNYFPSFTKPEFKKAFSDTGDINQTYSYAQDDEDFQADQPQQPSPEPQDLFDPYKILGVGPKAAQSEIQQKYREQVKLYHPDLVNHLGPDLKKFANERTKEIQRAYERLRSLSSTYSK